MAIPQPSYSTDKIVQYSDYHVAAVEAQPAAAHLAPAVQELVDALEAAQAASRTAARVVARAYAQQGVADAGLDEACRQCHLGALGAVSKDTKDPRYQAAFPKGLSAIVAGRGKRQETQVKDLLTALANHLPAVAEAHGGPLSAALVASEKKTEAYVAAQRAEGEARTNEIVARNAVIDQLHRNRGALRTLYPRDARTVRSFFPPSGRSSGGGGSGDGGEGPDES